MRPSEAVNPRLSGGGRETFWPSFARGANLLLDEPTNHLDLVYQKQIFTLIRDWIAGTGRSVLSVVHDLSLARAYGTNTLLLHKGRLIASGRIGRVLSRGTSSPPFHGRVRLDAGNAVTVGIKTGKLDVDGGIPSIGDWTQDGDTGRETQDYRHFNNEKKGFFIWILRNSMPP